MVAQRHKAYIKGLGIKGLPAMDMRVNAVMNCQTGKILHPEHEWRPAFVSHNEHIRHKTGKAYQIMPAEHATGIKVVQGHILPAAGAQLRTEKGAAQPQKFLHDPPAVVKKVFCMPTVANSAKIQ